MRDVFLCRDRNKVQMYEYRSQPPQLWPAEAKHFFKEGKGGRGGRRDTSKFFEARDIFFKQGILKT